MPIVDHGKVPEVPWRPDYRKWDITSPKDGTTSSNLSYSDVGVGAGAPLHTHEADELIVILGEGWEVRLGDEVHQVGADHTMVVPPGMPHGFISVGPDAARILTFFPIPDPFDHTAYLEGGPPEAHRD